MGEQFNENNPTVPSQDSTHNVQSRDVVGNKTDTAAVPSSTTSVVAIIKKIHAEIATLAEGGEIFGKSGPASIEIDDDATYALELYDVGDTVPTTSEIVQGNYQIDRIRDAVLTNIVASTPASEATGKIYCSEVFSAVAGWAIGDLVLVTFSGGSIVQDGVTTVLPNAYFYSRVTREEGIESKVDVIDGYHDVPAKDSTDDAQIRDVVGKKDDTAVGAVGTTKSLMAYLKGILTDTIAIQTLHNVPAKDATTDTQARDVIGKKDDTAQTTVGTTRSIIAYVKGLLNQVADVKGDTTTLLQKATKVITLGTGAVPVTETLFTVTGEVECYVVGYIDTAATSAGALTLEVGVAGSTAGLIAQTAVGALLIDLSWVDATPAVLVTEPSKKIIANGADIIHTIAGAAAQTGAVTYYCWWRALSSDGNLVVA